MLSARSSIQPSGRGELLLWLNSVCTAQYPAVECLRDGVAYCALIDASARRVAENCTALGAGEAQEAQARRKRAAQLLENLDLDVTLTTCSNIEPSLDSMHIRGFCEKNMHTLQLMLRECVPYNYMLEVNASRLAGGKLQDHVSLLKWMHQFMTKMLNTYSKTAIERRVNTAESSGSVSGMRMTRSMRLKRQMLQEKYFFSTSSGLRDYKRIDDDESSFRWSGKLRTGSSENIASTEDSIGTGSYKTEPVKKNVNHPIDDIDKHTQFTLNERNVQYQNNYHHHQGIDSEQQAKSSFSVCKEYHPILVDLRSEVEEFEEFAVAANTRHQRSLTSSKEDAEPIQEDCITLCNILASNAPMVSLEQLGIMLEERDRLWQTFDLLLDALVQCGYCTEKLDSATFKDTANISPLVAKIMALISSKK